MDCVLACFISFIAGIAFSRFMDYVTRNDPPGMWW